MRQFSGDTLIVNYFLIIFFTIRLISFIIQPIWKESRDTLIINYSCWFADYSKLLPLFESWEDSPCYCNYWGNCYYCYYWWLYFVWQWLQMTMLLTNLPRNLAMNLLAHIWTRQKSSPIFNGVVHLFSILQWQESINAEGCEYCNWTMWIRETTQYCTSRCVNVHLESAI